MGVDVPPSELALSWFKVSLAYGSSSNAVGFSSWHSARQAKSRVHIFSLKSRQLMTYFHILICSVIEVAQIGRSGDLHIPEVEVNY